MKTLAGGALALIVGLQTAAAAGQYRSPGDMNDEDRMAMVASSKSYDGCLREKGSGLLLKYADVRQVADEAMKACESILGDLQARFRARNFPPAMADSIGRRIKSHAVQRVLPELMAASAQRHPGP